MKVLETVQEDRSQAKEGDGSAEGGEGEVKQMSQDSFRRQN